MIDNIHFSQNFLMFKMNIMICKRTKMIQKWSKLMKWVRSYYRYLNSRRCFPRCAFNRTHLLSAIIGIQVGCRLLVGIICLLQEKYVMVTRFSTVYVCHIQDVYNVVFNFEFNFKYIYVKKSKDINYRFFEIKWRSWKFVS